MKLRRAIISVILILAVLASTVVMLRLEAKQEDSTAREVQAATYDGAGKIEYTVATDVTAGFGTIENPFTILEIVPYDGYAEIGYLIGGKEPVDMERLCKIALGEVQSDAIGKSAAKEFIEHLADRGYMELLTEAEADEYNAIGSEAFTAYKYTEASPENPECYVANANSFLRESIGLKYCWKDNTVNYAEYDIDRYEFLGWYEKDTDYAFDFSKPVYTDVDVYAKWRLYKSDEKTVIEPAIKERETVQVTPAAGYPDGIRIQFVNMVPTSLSGQVSMQNRPADMYNVKTDGTKDAARITEPEKPTLTGTAEADNYILRGWSADSSGTMMYEFGSAIPASYIQDGEMTLYPIWVRKEVCVINFDPAIPEQYAIAGNEVVWPAQLSGVANKNGKKRFLTVNNGDVLSEAEVPELFLLGNVDYKVKNFVIDVVTATPDDLNKGGNINGYIDPNAVLENLDLIKKANVIMISPQTHFYTSVPQASSVKDIGNNNDNKTYLTFGEEGNKRTAVQIWEDCINRELFGWESQNEGEAETYGFLRNDLCWEVILAIFNETVLETQKAALIYDAECYHMALMLSADGDNSESPKKLLFGEKTEITLSLLTGNRNNANLTSKNNVYKLYLMMNQMNPNLFYESFLKEHIYPVIKDNSISTGCYNWPENTGEVSNEEINWNTATFLLCLLLDEADGNIWIEDGIIRFAGNPWEKWGVTWDVYTLSDNIDDTTGESIEEYGIVKGNCFTYESDAVNITDRFATNDSIPYQRHVSEVYDYYNKQSDTITMSEIVHYLIQITSGSSAKTPTAGYDKNIRVLELQPSESFLNPITWVWNINTYIDGFSGTTSITQQSSAEFIGKIEDLNSNYDLLYIGSDISAYEPTRKVYPETVINEYIAGEARTYNAGETVVLAEGQKVKYYKIVEKEVAAGATVNIEFPQILTTTGKETVKAGVPYTVKMDQPEDQTWPVRKLTEANGEERYIEHPPANISVKKGQTVIIDTDKEALTPVEKMVGTGSFTSPITQKYSAYEAVEEWLPAGSTVVLAEAKYLQSLQQGVTINPYSYVHTGAKVPGLESAGESLLGILGGNLDDNNTYYYSGNDITLARKNEILEFAAAGYPVVAASRLMKREENDVLTVNTEAVDSASNMYQLLTELAAGESNPESPYYGNFFYEGTTSASKNYNTYKQNLLHALVETKCELVINSMPVLYSDGKPVEESYINGKPGELDNKTMEIGFRIIDADNGYYQLNFYVDGNADGRFTNDERLSGKMQINRIIVGNKYPVTQLTPNQNYTVSVNLEGYVGVTPWKLEVVKNGNPVVRDSVVECSAILPKDNEKPTLKVLQVVPGNATIYLPTTEEMQALEEKYLTWNKKDTLDLKEFQALMQKHFSDRDKYGSPVDFNDAGHLYDVFADSTNTVKIPFNMDDWPSGAYRNTALGFWIYMRDVKDFKIEIDRMSLTEFIDLSKEKQDVDWAQAYNMLVLGFADMYPDINNDEALDVIEAFIASGRQTLFTHDTTSFRNNTNPASDGYAYWGFNVNRTFREVLGMDRYGATLMYPIDINGNLLTDGKSIRDAMQIKNDAPYKTGTEQDISTDEKLKTNVLNNQKTGNDLRYYVQGYSDMFLYRYENEYFERTPSTKRASKINVGQLTEYPYRIGDDIPLAETHSQYYQLDLETKDIVVWYTLEAMEDGSLFASPYHDARNNYYLYSRGNVIYSGVGHDRDLTVDELKLFINTFVASYRTPADPPAMEFQNSSANSTDTEYYYIDFDSWDDTKAIGTGIVTHDNKQYQRISYIVNEAVPLKNQKLTVDYHFASDQENGIPLIEITDDGNEKASKYYVLEQPITDEGALVTYSAETGEAAGELLVGKEYYVDIPISVLNGKDGVQFVFRACINYGRLKDQYVYAYKKVYLLRRGLYDLD